MSVCHYTDHRAMENTLHLMNSRNETYRKGLTRVEKSSKLYELRYSLSTLCGHGVIIISLEDLSITHSLIIRNFLHTN